MEVAGVSQAKGGQSETEPVDGSTRPESELFHTLLTLALVSRDELAAGRRTYARCAKPGRLWHESLA